MVQSSRHVEMQRTGTGRAAALEQLHGQAAAGTGRQREAQGRNRGLPRRVRRTEQESQRTAAGRGHLQAPHATRVELATPAQHGFGRAAGQGLLRGPKDVVLADLLALPGERTDHDQLRQVDTRRRPGRTMHGMRRRDQQRPAAGLAHPDQGRQ